MGAYADNLKRKQMEEKLNTMLESEVDNDKIESLKEVLNLLSDTEDGTNKLEDVIESKVSAAITAAIGEDGAITTWADDRYEPKATA